ncbi:MAG: hypothetical protein HC902_06065 [Calothrix sp. SM1_5_4]|nr:hypothetical protein [Calothrix sp. SM1_5_4]
MIDFNLFDDRQYTGVVDSITPSLSGGYIARGHLNEVEGSSFSLVIENGVTVANLSVEREIFEVRYSKSGVHTVAQVDPTKLGPDDPPLGSADWEFIHRTSGDEEEEEDDVGGDVAMQASATQDSENLTTIDVLIGYTPALRSAQGGDAAMMALIQLGLDQANAAFQNSQINTRLRLVGTLALAQDQSASATNDLSRLSGDGDGVWDEVHAARRSAAADIVHVLTKNLQSGVCGIGYVNSGSRPPSASHPLHASRTTA